MRWRSAGSGFGVGLALVGFAATGWCQEPPWLEWDAPAGCPSSDAFVERLRSMATSRSLDDTDVHARVHVEQRGDRWSARVVVAVAGTHAGAERTFDGASCAAIADAAALIVGLSLASAPSTPARTSEAPAAPVAAGDTTARDEPAPPDPAPRVIPAAAASPDAVPSRAAGAGPSVRASAIVDLGTLPAAGPGASLGASWRLGLFEASVDAAVFAGERGTVAGSTTGASVALASASAGACLAVPARDRFVMVPCAGFSLERLAVEGFGPPNAFVATQPVVVLPAAFAEAGVDWWPLRRLAFRAAIRGLAPFSRPTFVVLGPDGGAAHRPAFAAVEPSIGLVLSLDK